MSDPTVRGLVHLVEETKTFGQKGFRKRLIVLEQEQGGFTNYIPLEFIRDACDTVDGLQEGDEIEVTYRLGGRRWQRDSSSEVKYFLSAEAIAYKVIGNASGDVHKSANQAFYEAVEDDDAPF